MLFQWYEVVVFLIFMLAIGVLMWNRVIGFDLFFPIAIGYWLLATIANAFTGESVFYFLADVLALGGLCYFGYRVRTN